MDLNYLKELLAVMRQNNVDRFKVGDVEVHFGPDPGDVPKKLDEMTPAERLDAFKDLLKTENDDKDADELWST